MIAREIIKYDFKTLPDQVLVDAKKLGFSDDQICRIMNDGTDEELYDRRKAMGLTRTFKMVDTCSAEFEAKTPYFYSSFE